MIDKSALFLVTFVISCNGFWWGGAQPDQLQQPSKQVPVGYFRAYTYQPYSLPQHQQYSPIHTYQVSSRLFPNTMPVTWAQRQLQQQTSATGANFLATAQIQTGPPSLQQSQQPQQQQPQQPLQQQPQHQTHSQGPPQPMNTNSGSILTTSSAPGPHMQEFPLQSQQPLPQYPQNYYSTPQMKPQNYLQQDPVNLQYITNVAPLNVQHVQFVPCLCPVTVAVGQDIVDKRSDEVTMSENPEQQLTDEKLLQN